MMASPGDPGDQPIMYSIYSFMAVLLILICGNVGLLLFARAASREADLVVRTALGASRGRIVAQMFAEALVLGGVAAIVGVTAAGFALRTWGTVFLETNMGRLPFWFDLSLSPRTFAVAIVLTVAGAAVAGIMPAMKITRVPRVIFSAGMMPAMAAPTTVSTIAAAKVRGDRLRSNQNGRRPSWFGQNRTPGAKAKPAAVTPTIAATPPRTSASRTSAPRCGPARTERRADDQIGLTRCRARKQQQADVAADQDQQHGHELDRVHDRLVPGFIRRGDHREGPHARLEMLMGGRKFRGGASPGRRQFRLRGLDGFAGGEQAKDGDRGAGTWLLIEDSGLERQPHSCATGNSKPSRMTPTTVMCSVPSCTVRPSTWIAAKPRRHTS